LILSIFNFFKAAFKAALITIFFSISSYALVKFDVDVNITKKTQAKMAQMGEELYQKSGISTVIVAKKELDKKEFLRLKNSYLQELKAPYVIWFFAKDYYDNDVKRHGKMNLLISSDDLIGKYDESSMFSPFSGTFTKLIVIKKSKSDPTSAAFLNGYGDLTDMLAKSHGVKLSSSLGDESRETVNVVRVVFYLTVLFFILWYMRVKFFKKG